MDNSEIMRTAIGLLTTVVDSFATMQHVDGVPAIEESLLKERIDTLFGDLRTVSLTINIPPELIDQVREVGREINVMISRAEMLSFGFAVAFCNLAERYVEDGHTVADIHEILQEASRRLMKLDGSAGS